MPRSARETGHPKIHWAPTISGATGTIECQLLDYPSSGHTLRDCWRTTAGARYGENMSSPQRVRKPPRQKRLLHIVDDRGEGSAIILIHGIASSSLTFTHLLPLLAGHHREITIDLLGFGQSADGVSYTIDEHVAWLEHTIRSLHLLEPATIIGHSLGALLTRTSPLLPKLPASPKNGSKSERSAAVLAVIGRQAQGA